MVTYVIIQYIDVSKKVKKQAEIDMMVKTNIACQKWVRDHRLTQCSLGTVHNDFIVPTSWILDPSDKEGLSSRDQNREWVDELKKSMLSKGKLETDIELVSFEKDIIEAGFDPKNLQFPNIVNNAPFPMYAVVGLHSKTAVSELSRERPSNVNFQTCAVQKWIICTDTQRNIEMLNDYGVIDNTKRDTRKKISTWDAVANIHQAYVLQLKAHHNNPDSKQFKAAWKLRKDAIRGSYSGMSDGAWGQNMTIAQLVGARWKYVQQIFTGKIEDFEGKRQTIPSGIGSFKNMFNIPVDVTEKWLKRVVQGEWKLKTFNDNCIHYKREQSVKADIVEFIKEVRDCEYDDFDDVSEYYDVLRDEEWLLKLIAWHASSTSRDTYLGMMRQSVIQKLRAFEARQATMNEQAQIEKVKHYSYIRVYFICFLCLYIYDSYRPCIYYKLTGNR